MDSMSFDYLYCTRDCPYHRSIHPCCDTCATFTFTLTPHLSDNRKHPCIHPSVDFGIRLSPIEVASSVPTMARKARTCHTRNTIIKAAGQ